MTAPIKEGFMEKKNHKGLMGKQWTKRWVLLYEISDSGVPRLETFDSKEQATRETTKAMIIPLNTDVHKIVASNQAPKKMFTIDIVMSDKIHTFAVETQTKQEDWLLLMKKVANLGKKCNSLPTGERYDTHDFHQMAMRQQSSSSADSFHTEENTLYDSYDVKQYTVRIQDNEFTRHTLKLYGTYILSLDSQKLTLIHPENGNMLYAWPYKYLRRYGRDKTSFSMEAGRKCQSGPGMVVFQTTEGNNIFHQIQNFVNSISGSQSLNAAQKVKNHHHRNSHGSHEDMSSKVKPMSVTQDDDEASKLRSLSFTLSNPITQTKEFKDKIAAKRKDLYSDQTITPKSGARLQSTGISLNKAASTRGDQIYSEVLDKMLELEQPRMPMQDHNNDGYDIAADMGTVSHIAGHVPPDSDEYDELNILYTNPKEGGSGNAWMKSALPADNIHEEMYISGQTTKKPQKSTNRKPNRSPKVKPRQEARKLQHRQEPDESFYSTATASSPVPTSSLQQDTGHEVYDHLERHQKLSKPAPAPHRVGPPVNNTRKPMHPSPVEHQKAPIYDHLERQNKAKPPPIMTKKPKVKNVKKVNPNPTYGTLFGEEDKGKKEESAYGQLFPIGNEESVEVAEDQDDYLTRAETVPHQEYSGEQTYDEPNRQLWMEDNEESLYDLPT